ncbi:PTPRM-like protein [Mya arenaria]|uniref:PTPRM-like protein n=1 Tax=Mya arenaria TaxID=6604 RepID=A0ABY7F3B7_MYAAR|nr:PTPRM-like protein [Mya arenaria]
MMISIFAVILYLMNVICGICPPGKHGDSCSNNCTYPHCFCSSERACEGCEIGYWDRRQNCSLTCIFPTCRCTNHTNCLSCKDGSYGLENKCNKTCPSGCDNNTCENNGMCFSCKPNYTGNKCDSCVDGLYGVNCSLQCSQGCEGNVCNSLDGSCNCSKMYSGEKCESCIDGLYGVSCSESCSTGCVQNNCSAINGNCDCKEYYKGDTCNVCVDGRDGDHCLNKAEIKNTQTEADKPNVGAAVEETAEDAILEIDEDDQIARAIATKFEEKGGLYYNNADKINKQKVAIGNLTTYVVEKTDIDMEEEFEGYNKRHAYIAALGPMSKQLGDFSPFWQMIWQEKVEKIVMLTNLVEEGKDKCEQYWPNPGTDKHYGRVFISCQTEAEYAEFTRREFTISKDSETRQLHHLHFTCWPDKGVPEDVTGIVEFRQRVLNLPDQFDGPVLVHCSAGVGRTGTYIALDMLTKEGESEGAIHIPGCVINMRQDRAYMIQTLNQYQFLHRALVCSLSDISKQIRGKHFRQYMKQMEDEDFSRQFQEMQTVLEKSSDNEIQAIERNKSLKGKNRPFADVPGDRNRPSLSLDIQSGSSGYVNAVYIDSLKARNRFLVVQSPMKGTVIDFLTLLYQENCTCVISFEPPMAKQKRQTIGLYYPADNKILKQGVFQVCCTKTENHGYCIQRLLTIKHSGTTEQPSERVVHHFEFNGWDYTREVPESTKDFLKFIEGIDVNLRETSNRGPLLVHCLDGAGKSALFCIVSILLEKMGLEQEVSVVNTIRKVKSRRRSAIPNKAQFEFCHGCVLSYVKSFDYSQYSNFTENVSNALNT